MRQHLWWLPGVTLAIVLGIVDSARAQDYPFVFRDVGDQAGLFPHVAGIKGHGAAWGDVDGDGWIDLYVATFYSPSTKRNLLFRNHKGKFHLDDQEAPRLAQRATGVIFADLNNDGNLDLYVASMPKAAKPGQDKGLALAGCSLFRNDGGGKLTNVSEGNGACPPAFGGRSATVLDFDGDGLLDLLVGEDPIPGYNGSKTKSSRLFRNRGGLQFEDVSRAVGLPPDIPGLGVAVGDVNNDGWPDFFLAANRGGNVLFLNDRGGKFREAPGSRQLFAWPDAKGDDTPCGVCIADINRDGLLDIIIGHHYQRPWLQPVPIRVYVNRGIKDGVPIFEDVTALVGIIALPMKPPHVEIQDFDNDGWPDLVTSIVRFKDGQPYPVIFKHLGVQKDGLPCFREYTSGINDFPTPEDKAIKKTGVFFDKVIKEKKILYTAPGPSGDFDNDGRLDLFLANWWEESRSLLLRNETPGGNWLQVQVEGGQGVNRMGIGSRVNVYPAGKLGDAKALLGCREIATGYGYASGQPALAHFGLGKTERVDIEVISPHGKGTLSRRGVQANQRVSVKRDEGK
jgi:hypothetical protein